MVLPLVSAFINFLMKDQAAKVIMHLASVMTAGNITSLISGFLLKPARFIKALKGLSTKELLNLQTLVNNELKFRNGDLFRERAEVLKKWFPDKAKEIDSLLKNRGQFQDFWKKTKANKSLTKEQLAQYEELEKRHIETANEWVLLTSSWILMGKFNYETNEFIFTTKANPNKSYSQIWTIQDWEKIKLVMGAGTYLWYHHPLWIAKLKKGKKREVKYWKFLS